jgi:hypothetical protein
MNRTGLLEKPYIRMTNNVIKILDSGNKTVTHALEANIKAFLLATKIEKVEVKGGDQDEMDRILLLSCNSNTGHKCGLG